jgi:hypothetical protein
LHGGDITLEVIDDGVEVNDQLLLEKLVNIPRATNALD